MEKPTMYDDLSPLGRAAPPPRSRLVERRLDDRLELFTEAARYRLSGGATVTQR
jgi:hypothetical protein